MSFQHVVWDMGGTLLDTYPQVDATFAAVVTESGHQVEISRVAQLTRKSTGEAIDVLSREYQIPAEEFDRAYDDLKDTWEHSPAPLMAGALDVIRAVRDGGGLNLVITHRERASAQSLLDATGLAALVDDMLCAPDGYPRKPAPDMYVLMAERHGVAASDCLAVGDRSIDAQAAHNAGMKAAMLDTPGLPTLHRADYHVTHLADLLPLIGARDAN